MLKMFDKANRLQDPKNSTTPPGSTFFRTRFVKIDFRSYGFVWFIMLLSKANYNMGSFCGDVPIKQP